MIIANQPSSTNFGGNCEIIVNPLHEKDSVYLVLNLSRTYTHTLLIVQFQFIHSIRPYNAYNDAILEEYIENRKHEKSQLTSAQQLGPSTAHEAPHRRVLTNTSSSHPNSSPNEPTSILLIKVLLLARIDLLTRVHAVLQRDNETLERLGEEQARQIERLRRISEDFFMRMCHMEKLLQLRTVQIIELRQRVDTAQRVSSDGTFVWNLEQVGFLILFELMY